MKDYCAHCNSTGDIRQVDPSAFGGVVFHPCPVCRPHVPRVIEEESNKLRKIDAINAPDRDARALLKELLEREEPIDGCVVLCFDKGQSGEMFTSGLPRTEVTYLLTFFQASVLKEFQEKMV